MKAEIHALKKFMTCFKTNSLSQKDKYDINFMWNLKKRLQMYLSTKQKYNYRYRK